MTQTLEVQTELTDHWLDNKFEIGGLAFKGTAPKLTQSEMDQVPGAAAALGKFDQLKLEVCCRDGARVIIKPDEDRYWLDAVQVRAWPTGPGCARIWCFQSRFGR